MGSIGNTKTSYEIDPGTGYYNTSNIKKLYHWVESDAVRDYVLKNGIVPDDQGSIYLSQKPLFEDKGHYFEVTIPDNNNLYDWREMWYDDSGKEFDSDHQYDKNNPYFMYQYRKIPKEYVKLVK